jgi:hypothetical protein
VLFVEFILYNYTTMHGANNIKYYTTMHGANNIKYYTTMHGANNKILYYKARCK